MSEGDSRSVIEAKAALADEHAAGILKRVANLEKHQKLTPYMARQMLDEPDRRWLRRYEKLTKTGAKNV